MMGKRVSKLIQLTEEDCNKLYSPEGACYMPDVARPIRAKYVSFRVLAKQKL